MPTTVTDTSTDKVVLATTVIGTTLTLVTAWEPFAGHSTVRSDDAGGHLGEIVARPLPAEIEAMPGGSPERMAAAIDFAAANVADAYAAISEVYPELLDREDVTIERGTVAVWGSPSAVPCHGGCGELAEPSPEGIAWCGTVGR